MNSGPWPSVVRPPDVRWPPGRCALFRAYRCDSAGCRLILDRRGSQCREALRSPHPVLAAQRGDAGLTRRTRGSRYSLVPSVQLAARPGGDGPPAQHLGEGGGDLDGDGEQIGPHSPARGGGGENSPNLVIDVRGGTASGGSDDGGGLVQSLRNLRLIPFGQLPHRRRHEFGFAVPDVRHKLAHAAQPARQVGGSPGIFTPG
jgi:hypothetical protein